MNKDILKEVFTNDRMTLEILAEEATEICQAKSKIIRFGLSDEYNNTYNPTKTNKEKLEIEIIHLLAVVDILEARGIISLDGIEQGKQDKWIKMQKWSAYKGSNDI